MPEPHSYLYLFAVAVLYPKITCFNDNKGFDVPLPLKWLFSRKLVDFVQIFCHFRLIVLNILQKLGTQTSLRLSLNPRLNSDHTTP